MSSISKLTQKLQKLGLLKSLNDSRILAYLSLNSSSVTAKQICFDLNLPDSKVYPALITLEKANLILKDERNRPSKYYINDPETLTTEFNKQIETIYNDSKKQLKEISEIITNNWDPKIPNFGNIAYLFKGKSLKTELLRLQKTTQSHISFILAPQFINYIDNIKREIIKLLERGVIVEIAIPHTDDFIDIINMLKEQKSPILKLKNSIWTGTSYVIQDRKVMFNVTHTNIEDIAILTNDSLLVNHIAECWSNPICCIETKPIKLELRD